MCEPDKCENYNKSPIKQIDCGSEMMQKKEYRIKPHHEHRDATSECSSDGLEELFALGLLSGD